MFRLFFAAILAALILVALPVVMPPAWLTAEAKPSRAQKSQKSQKTQTTQKTKSSGAKSSSKKSEAQGAEQSTTPLPAVSGEPAVPIPAVEPPVLTLSTDRSTYKAGDLLTVAAMSNKACDLTLISIDGDGFASVLFPNEFEPNNSHVAGAPISIPRSNAAYQLRVKRVGTEALLGICSPTGTRPRGIVADYERYRFTLLGDWVEFTDKIDQREREIVKAAAEAQRKRRRREPPLPPLMPHSLPSEQGRTLLLIEVDEVQ